jgi:glycine oxidase
MEVHRQGLKPKSSHHLDSSPVACDGLKPELSAEVVIVGGGVIGCSLAYALCKRGVEVVVLDQGEIGAQASRAATGMLAPLKPFAKPTDPYTILLLESLARFPALVAELEEMTGIDIEYSQTGTLRIMSPKQASRLERWIALWQQEGYPLALLGGEQLRTCEPALAPHVSLALYRPGEPQLTASHLTQAFARAAERLGARFFAHEEVVALHRHGSTITAVQTAHGQSIACQHLVLATGAWAGRCATWLDLTLPVQPLRAQSIAVCQPAIPIQHLLFGGGIYLAPKRNGTVIVGVARDEAGFDVQTMPEGIAWLFQAAQGLVPGLAACPIEQAWAALLPITPDARPILGQAPCWDNVTLACGYNGYGVLLAARTGELLAEHIVTGQQPESLRPFALERFSS